MTKFQANATEEKVRAVMMVFDENHDTNVETRMEKSVREVRAGTSVRTQFTADMSDPEQSRFVEHMRNRNFDVREVA